jgi:dihydrofolate synthase/folylpolyglutamate synthase
MARPPRAVHADERPAGAADAAHNPEGARALRDYLVRWHPERPSLVVGIMRDKDADAILRELLPATSSVIATAADTHRAMPADELAAHVSRSIPPGPSARAPTS